MDTNQVPSAACLKFTETFANQLHQKRALVGKPVDSRVQVAPPRLPMAEPQNPQGLLKILLFLIPIQMLLLLSSTHSQKLLKVGICTFEH